jgi:hypothetical protein
MDPTDKDHDLKTDIDSILKLRSEELSRRLLPLPAVPEGFQALTASQEELARYVYPARPDADNEAARRIWSHLMRGALPTPGWEDQVLPLKAGPVPYAPGFNQSGFRGRLESSRNWSGAVTHASGSGHLRTIFGMWEVPRVRAPAGAQNGVWACSSWIGMDGYAPTSFNLPQIGTSHYVVVEHGHATIYYEAWYQWWTRGGPTAPVTFQNLPVQAGDLIATSVQFITPREVWLMIRNVTSGLPPIRQRLSAPAVSNVAAGLALGEARGITAEWITERPMKIGSTFLYPLPEFDAVTFVSGQVTTDAATTRGLGPVRMLRMVEPQGHRATVIARPRIDQYPSDTVTVGPGVERRMGG